MFNIDAEKLISAVKARPALYNKHDKMYYANKNQNHFKEMLWLEVALEVCGNTDLLKDNYVSEVQKRWRSLRSCFARELAIQRREQLRNADEIANIKKRKKYEYFDSLIFLKGEADSSELKDSNKENETAKLLVNSTNEHVFFYNENSEDMLKEIKLEAPDYYEIKETERYSGEEMKREEHDEDQQFALSIVPSLRKLDSKRKLEVKIDILKAIKAVTFKNEYLMSKNY